MSLFLGGLEIQSLFFQGEIISHVNLLDNVPAGCPLSGNLLVCEGRHPGAEAAVVGVIVTTLFFGFFQQPCSVSSQGLVPSRNIILRENEELDDDARLHVKIL